MALPATAAVHEFGDGGKNATLPGSTRRVGSVLGAYRLVTELGEGGMGTVYYAEHVSLGRRAAIKVLNPDVARDPELVDRFFLEARAANRIGHPGIVDVSDLGTDGGVHYLVMEMLEGETLGARIERVSRLSAQDAVRFLAEAADALDAAHRRGIVHRDLKPENLFLARDGASERVKVLDFGIAKLTGHDDVRRTKTGLVMGTPAYMSPEQCLGEKDLDSRSDVYSLGVVAFEALTGHPPFSAGSIGKLIVAHTHEVPVAPSSLQPDVPARLDAVVLRALAKKREDRFTDMKEMRDALRDALSARAPHLARVPAVSGELAVAAVEAQQTRSVGARLRGIICARLAEDRLRLPSMPLVVMRALSLLKGGDVPIARLAETLEGDPLLVPKLLRVANSAAYASTSQATTVHQAVARLGVRKLRALLTEAAASEVFTSTDPEIARSFRELWDHCVAVASVSRTLARGEPVDGEEVYLAALLHDVGKPVVGALLLETERSLLTELGAAWMGRSLWEKIVDDAHRDVGEALAKKWKLPDTVVAAIARGTSEPIFGGPSSVETWLGYAHALVVRDDALLERMRTHVGGSADREQAALAAAEEAVASR